MNTVWDNVDKFESLIANYAGSKYAIAVDSCTNALFLSLKYCKEKLKLNHNFIEIPKQTYVSVPMQVINAGYKVKFVDKSWAGSYKLGSLPIIDSAQKFGSQIYEKDTFYCLSFNFKKILSTGKGGMILTDDINAFEWFKRIRYDGRPSIYYNDMLDLPVEDIGYHMYMTPEQAVMGIQNFYALDKHRDCNSSCSSQYKVDLSKLKCFNENNSIR
jgi:dTDP-4-amino-4,6-dideoxygalactose transaminase